MSSYSLVIVSIHILIQQFYNFFSLLLFLYPFLFIPFLTQFFFIFFLSSSPFFSSPLLSPPLCLLFFSSPPLLSLLPNLRLEKAKKHYDSALQALREKGDGSLHPRHADLLAGTYIHIPSFLSFLSPSLSPSLTLTYSLSPSPPLLSPPVSYLTPPPPLLLIPSLSPLSLPLGLACITDMDIESSPLTASLSSESLATLLMLYPETHHAVWAAKVTLAEYLEALDRLVLY